MILTINEYKKILESNNIKTTKEDVKRLYDECLNLLNDLSPLYYNVVKQYTLTFGNKKNSYGSCNYRNMTIIIHMYSCEHIENEEVNDTILHEMAHAIDRGVNGVSSGHGYPWKKICREIGCKPESRSDAGQDVIKKSKFVLIFAKDDGYEYIQPVHRITNKKPLDTFLPHIYLTGKPQTKGKLKVVTFDDYQNNKIIEE